MNSYLRFQVGEGHFLIELAAVHRILPFENVMKVPLAPRFVEGVLNLGGEVVPVINLRARFSLPSPSNGARRRVIVAGWTGGRCGLLVDKVREIVELDQNSIEPASSLIPGLKAEVLEGVARAADALLFVLDAQRLLAAQGSEPQ